MKVVIIGAGIAGLGAAHYFLKKGHEVQVLESSERVGGRAMTYQRPGTQDIVDVGTQYYHSSYRRALAFINESGMQSNIRKIRGYTRIYDDNLKKGSFLFNRYLPWYQSYGVAGNLQLGLYLAKTFIKYEMDPYALNYYAKADDINAVINNSNQAIYKSIIQPLTQVGALSEPEEMAVSLHHMHRLIHIILFTEYLSLTGGVSSLHKAMSKHISIALESPVLGLVEENGNLIGVQLENEVIKADHIVVATTPHVASKMVPESWGEAHKFLNEINIPQFSLPTFFLDRPIETGVWSFLLHQHEGMISYLTDASQKNKEMVPSGKSIIQPWVCYPQSATLAAMSDDDITSCCINEIETIFPGFGSWIEHVHITRHPYGVPFHSTGHVKQACDFMHAMDKRKISFCGDYLSGGYMESALWSAERAAKVFG